MVLTGTAANAYKVKPMLTDENRLTWNHTTKQVETLTDLLDELNFRLKTLGVTNIKVREPSTTQKIKS